MSATDHDVVVLGGGLTGLLFALLLRGEPGARRLRIAVVEAGSPPAPPVAGVTGLRVFSIAPASRDLLAAAGAWPHFGAERRCAYRRMIVWQGERPGPESAGHTLTFDAAEAGVAELGFIMEHDVLRHALWQQAVAAADVTLVSDAGAVTIAPGADCIDVQTAAGAVLHARLLVAADGADSTAREALGVRTTRRPYGQRAIVAHLRSEQPHGHTAWQRFLPGGPLALLPLADGRSSLVWSCPEADVPGLMALPAAEFSAAVTTQSAGVLGALTLTTPRVSFALACGQVDRYTGRRFALIGDAAHQVHPLAGLGVNLGFQDAAVLAAVLGRHLAHAAADPGDPSALRGYERRRRGANLLAQESVDLLHHLFTARAPGIAALAGAGLGWVNRLGPLKRHLAGFAMGAARGVMP